ncbi:MAG: class I SAM-dependent methyltransferase [Patescibacteria group bacterium]
MDNLDLLKRFPEIGGEDYNLFKKAVPWHDDFQKKVGDFLSSYFSNREGRITLVEAGTGTGLTTLVLLNSLENTHIISVENEPKMLAVARGSLKDFKDRVDFVENDILSALKGMDSESVDGFASAYTIHNLPPDYRNELFVEISRVIKKDGIFVNADKYAREGDAHVADLSEQIEDFNFFDGLGRSDLKEKWTKHYLEDDEIKITEKEQIEILNELGFTNIETIFRERLEAIIKAEKI